jgi:hypothetical protein
MRFFMLNPKTFFPYLFGLVSLLVSLGIVSQGKLVEVEGLPPPSPSATPLPKPERFPGAAKLVRCQDLSEPRFFFYMPLVTAASEKRLTISGTVYTSNLTPLSGALVEVRQVNINQMNKPYPPVVFNDHLYTDEAGHYEFTTLEPTQQEQFYLHYRVTYQNYCPVLMRLHLVVEPPSRPAKHIFAQIEVVGPVLQGSVNIVVPVPPLP